MLILSRKKEESIIINDNIEIRIVSISDGKVKIGIDAPRNIEILRKEVKEAVIEENKQAIKEINMDMLRNLNKK